MSRKTRDFKSTIDTTVSKTSLGGGYLLFAGAGLLYLLMHFIPVVAPTQYLWGMDSWRYIHPALPIMFAALGILSFVPRVQNAVFALAGKTGRVVGSIPLIIYLPVSGALFWLGRQEAFLLGDGRLRITNTESGYLFSVEEPLDTLLHTGFYNLLKDSYSVGAREIYQWVRIGAGIAALWGITYYLKRIFDNNRDRWIVGLLVMTTGAVQLFFGYVESYTVAASLIILFLFSSLAMLKQECFSVLPAFFLFTAAVTHPVAVVFLPGALYAYHRVIHSAARGVSTLKLWLLLAGIGCGVAGSIVVTFWVNGVHLQKFLENFLHGSNMLPFMADAGGYGMMSPAHLSDMLNEIFLVIPSWPAIFLVIPVLGSRRNRGLLPFLLLCTAGTFILMAAFNPKLGYARDWDIFSFTAFPATFAIGLLLFESGQTVVYERAVPVILISLFNTAPWIWINASEEKALARCEHLALTPYWPPMTRALALDTLGSYYYAAGEMEKCLECDAEAFELVRNKRYFSNVVKRLYSLKDIKRHRAYITKDSLNAEGRFYLGSTYLELKMLSEAQGEFEWTLALEPSYPKAHFQLGQICVERSFVDEEIRYYREALTVEKTPEMLSLIHNNIGYGYVLKGMFKEAKAEFERAIEYNKNSGLAHYDLAYIHFALRKYDDAAHEARLALSNGYNKAETEKLLNAAEQARKTQQMLPN